uniref:Glutamate ionotropic receptor NMDA type subunit 2B n=3 Tax=Catarrhini TaxID=9526 RepID=Q4R3W6_MACFA|nr:unnamed protein product [Macaca fascicularis]BAK64018.1 glutamate [NMDA] receptor subunit epsilon 2 precursor [Pan troglodytes]
MGAPTPTCLRCQLARAPLPTTSPQCPLPDITTTTTPAAATCSASRSTLTGSRKTLSSPLLGTTSACSMAANPTSSGSPRWRGRRKPGRTSGPLSPTSRWSRPFMGPCQPVSRRTSV